MRSKKPIRPSPRVRHRSPTVVDERAFTVVLEDLHAKFDVFGEALQGLRQEMHGMRDELRAEMRDMRDELRSEMHGMRDELRTDIALLQTAVLDVSKRIP